MVRGKVKELVEKALKEHTGDGMTIFAINKVYPGLQPEEISDAIRAFKVDEKITVKRVGPLNLYNWKT